MNVRLYFVLIAGGGCLFYYGFQEFKLGSVASEVPQAMTLKELADKGPGDNANVVVSDFLLCVNSYVYQERNGRWTDVWVPAVPTDGEYHQKLLAACDENGNITGALPIPKDVKVIVKLTGSVNEARVVKVSEKHTIHGMIVNEIESLSSQEKNLLASSYPGINFGRCWILEVGRTPASPGMTAGFMGGGAILVVLGVLLFLLPRFRGGGNRQQPKQKVEKRDLVEA